MINLTGRVYHVILSKCLIILEHLVAYLGSVCLNLWSNWLNKRLLLIFVVVYQIDAFLQTPVIRYHAFVFFILAVTDKHQYFSWKITV